MNITIVFISGRNTCILYIYRNCKSIVHEPLNTSIYEVTSSSKFTSS